MREVGGRCTRDDKAWRWSATPARPGRERTWCRPDLRSGWMERQRGLPGSAGRGTKRGKVFCTSLSRPLSRMPGQRAFTSPTSEFHPPACIPQAPPAFLPPPSLPCCIPPVARLPCLYRCHPSVLHADTLSQQRSPGVLSSSPSASRLSSILAMISSCALLRVGWRNSDALELCRMCPTARPRSCARRFLWWLA